MGIVLAFKALKHIQTVTKKLYCLDPKGLKKRSDLRINVLWNIDWGSTT